MKIFAITRITLTSIVFCCSFLIAMAQNRYSLDTCIAHAILQQKFDELSANYQRILFLQEQNADKSYLPSLSLQAKSTIQNTQIDIPIENSPFTIPTATKNISTALLVFNQSLYDGGITKFRKKLMETELAENEIAIQLNQYKITGQLSGMYTTILLLQKQDSILSGFKNVLRYKLKEIQSAMENDMALESDIAVIQSAIIQVDQKLTENKFKRISIASQLSILTGLPIDTNSELQTPKVIYNVLNDFSSRLEIKLLNQHAKSLDLQKEITKLQSHPKIQLFGNAGYGNPGFNIFDTGWNTMLIAGISMQWNILDWNSAKMQREIITVQQKNISISKDQLFSQLSALLREQASEINKLNIFIEQDNHLIKLQKTISKTYSTRLKEGTITLTEYLDIENKNNEAQLNLALHQLQLIIAKINYNLITGNF